MVMECVRLVDARLLNGRVLSGRDRLVRHGRGLNGREARCGEGRHGVPARVGRDTGNLVGEQARAPQPRRILMGTMALCRRTRRSRR